VIPTLENDHVRLSQAVAESTVANARLRPQSTITGKKVLVLEDCRALALGQSLEIQQTHIEEVTQKAVEYSNLTKMLPRAFLSTELGWRDNPQYSYSAVLGFPDNPPQYTGNPANPWGTGQGVGSWSTGRLQNTWRYVLESRWTPTDAALAFYLAKSSRNDKQKHHYVRVRVAQRLLGVVDSSFFRLLSLQKTIPMAARIVAIRSDVANRMEALFRKQLVQAEDVHKSKQKLVKAERLLSSLRSEAENQRNLLASAMYLSPEYCVDGGFNVAGELSAPTFVDEICTMELAAIKNRPEAYRAGLDHINSLNDLQRTIIKYFPKVTGYWRFTRDQDKHAYNRDWKDIGVMVYFDLIDLCANFWESKAAKMITEKTYKEIGVVALGITSQVRTSAVKYYDALDNLKASEKSFLASESVLKILRERAARDAQQKLALLEAEGDLINEQIDVIRATGDSQSTLAELRAAMGTNYNEPFAR
jgi:outer membrane protein TolC